MKAGEGLHGFKLTDEDRANLEHLPPQQVAALSTPGKYGEIAVALGISPGTVRSRIHRARHALIRMRKVVDEDAPA